MDLDFVPLGGGCRQSVFLRVTGLFERRLFFELATGRVVSDCPFPAGAVEEARHVWFQHLPGGEDYEKVASHQPFLLKAL
eukprot:3656659-Amphidinium_carterae.1